MMSLITAGGVMLLIVAAVVLMGMRLYWGLHFA